MKKIKLNESTLRKIIRGALHEMLNEDFNDPYDPRYKKQQMIHDFEELEKLPDDESDYDRVIDLDDSGFAGNYAHNVRINSDGQEEIDPMIKKVRGNTYRDMMLKK